MTALEVCPALFQGGIATVKLNYNENQKRLTVPYPELLPTDNTGAMLLRNIYPRKQLNNSRSHLWSPIWFAAQCRPSLVSRLLLPRCPVNRIYDSNDQWGTSSNGSPQVLPMQSWDFHWGLPIPVWKRTSWICWSLPVDHSDPHLHCHPHDIHFDR